MTRSFPLSRTFVLPLLLLSIALGAGGEAHAKPRKKSSLARKVALNPETGEFAGFAQWREVGEFMDQMVARHGFNRTELEAIMRKVQYLDSAVQLMRPAPPGKPKNWRAYRARFVEPVRINAGVAFWDEYADALARAEARFGVPAEIIVGIIGVETVYGRNTGNFRVLDAVTTLAFAYPDTPNRAARMAYFRGEVENTLLFARDSGIDPFSLLGSYAGAIGWPQFMPGSIRQYAIDFDEDRRINLRGSPVDAIGSVANFLVQHGWKKGEPIVFPATVGPAAVAAVTSGGATTASVTGAAVASNGATTTSDATGAGAASTPSSWEAYIGRGLEATFKLDELKAAGVTPGIEPPPDMPLGLVDLQNGTEPTEYWLGAANFFAITKYNRSFFYAMSVIDLGRAVRNARGR